MTTLPREQSRDVGRHHSRAECRHEEGQGLRGLGDGAMQLRGSRVMVTGGNGFLGRRIVFELEQRGATPIVVRSADYDLTDPVRVRSALEDTGVAYVIHAAAVVGGIG